MNNKLEDVAKATREEILAREMKKNVERKTMLELNLALQAELSPDEKSARKPLRYGSDGKAISWEEITRKEHMEILQKELEDAELVISVLNKEASK